jgi:elongation factor 1-alpha
MSEKPLVNLVFIGHVDCGKSTLIGRTLYETGAISETVMKKLEEETAKLGKEHAKFAWIMDKLKDEREADGRTTDVGYRSFETRKNRFVIIDCPGHRDFVGNMISGASQADAAVLVVSAAPGEFEAGIKQPNLKAGDVGGQTREHIILAYTLGIRQLIIAVNKMDTVNYNQGLYESIKEQTARLLDEVGYTTPWKYLYVPIAAYYGENISRRSRKMLWYDGPTFLEALDTLQEGERPIDKPLRIPILRGSFMVKGVGLISAGRIETGKLKVGDEIIFEPSGTKGIVRSIEMYHKPLQEAFPGDDIGIALRGVKKGSVWKGCVAGHVTNPPTVTQKLKARIVVIEHPTGIRPGYSPTLYCHHERVESRIEEIEAKLNPATGETVSERPDIIRKGDAAVVWLSTTRPIVIERASDIPRMSRFALRDLGITIAVGMCIDLIPLKKNP